MPRETACHKPERQAVVEKLAGFTGLDKDFIDNRNLRIDSRSFVNELLRKEGQVVGRMDSRFTAANLDPAGHSHFDPTIATIRPPFTATFNDYVRGELGFQSDLEYFTLGGGIGPLGLGVKKQLCRYQRQPAEHLCQEPLHETLCRLRLL